MRDQGNAAVAPAPGTADHRMQRVLLLELVANPPAEPESIEALAASLREPAPEVRAAAEALAAAGLASTAGGHVQASESALYFDALWPAGAATSR
jgi:hypothetical protein